MAWCGRVLVAVLVLGCAVAGHAMAAPSASVATDTIPLRRDTTAQATPDAADARPAQDPPVPWPRWETATGDWNGHRPALDRVGLAIAGQYTWDASMLAGPGVTHAPFARGLLQLRLYADLAPLVGLRGARVHVHYHAYHGVDGTTVLGTLQPLSGIDAAPFSRLGEAWLEQRLVGDRLRVKLGRIDLASEFALLASAGEFVNASAGTTPTIVDAPVYPVPRAGALALVQPLRALVLGGAIFEGRDGGFWVGQLGVVWPGASQGAGGRLELGRWRSVDAASGWYGQVEQEVWRRPEGEDAAHTLTLFAQYGRTDRPGGEAREHGSVGATLVGPLGRPVHEVAGLRVSGAHAGTHGAGHPCPTEVVVEGFYRVQVTPFLGVKPDLQWIHHSASDPRAGDAFVATIRFDAAL